eukprot:225980_1
MKTKYVGTRGYQATELLLDKPYDLACDIFSMGVVLFILITGYPPFEQAHYSGIFENIWQYHNECSLFVCFSRSLVPSFNQRRLCQNLEISRRMFHLQRLQMQGFI